MDHAKTYLAGPNQSSQLDGDDTNSCIGVEANGVITYTISEDLKACGTEMINNGTHFLFKNAVQCAHGMTNGFITRQRNLRMNYECAFENTFTITYSNAIQTTITSVEVDLGTVESTFDVAFSLFEDETFELPIQGII